MRVEGKIGHYGEKDDNGKVDDEVPSDDDEEG